MAKKHSGYLAHLILRSESYIVWLHHPQYQWTAKIGLTRRIMELSYQGTFVPRNESSMGGTFVPWNFRSQEPSFPGTFIPMTDIKGELSFPNSKIIILY